jgi:ethanolamine ammonia-lyase small subunit
LSISDGLSAKAVELSAIPLAVSLYSQLEKAGLSYARTAIVSYGRVAVADEISYISGAKMAVILIGERPGLSAPDSMGVYLTYGARPGTTDEARRCISNIRPGGLSIQDGLRKLCYMLQEALRLGSTGIGFKDDMPQGYLPFQGFSPERLP